MFVGECVKEFICIFMVPDYITLSLCILNKVEYSPQV